MSDTVTYCFEGGSVWDEIEYGENNGVSFIRYNARDFEAGTREVTIYEDGTTTTKVDGPVLKMMDEPTEFCEAMSEETAREMIEPYKNKQVTEEQLANDIVMLDKWTKGIVENLKRD